MLLLNSSNDKMVKAYFNNNSSFNYNGDMVLDIPDISLKNIVKKSDDKFKLLDRYLVYYKNNNYKNGIVILGHSGMGYGTYFNRLDELEKAKDKVKYTIDFEVKKDKNGNWKLSSLSNEAIKKIQGMY